MGYSTTYKGKLLFPEGMTIAMLKNMRKLIKEAADLNMCLCITTDLDGIEWDGGEKYGHGSSVEHVNYLTEEMKKEYPEFKFTGHIDAQGESVDDRWVLHVDEEGVASRKDPTAIPDPDACSECGGIGWDVYRTDTTGTWEVQRCDACAKFETDEQTMALVPAGVNLIIARCNDKEC